VFFLAPQEFPHFWQDVPEGIPFGQDSPTKMSDLTLIMIPKIDHDRFWILHSFVKASGIQVATDIGDIEAFIGQTIGHQLWSNFNLQLEKRVSAFLQSQLEGNAWEPRPHDSLKGLSVFTRDTDLSVDPFSGDIGSPKDLKGLPVLKKVQSKSGGIVDPYIAVEG
jgi:hypothetical protein